MRRRCAACWEVGRWITAAGTGVAISLVAAIPLGRSAATDHCHGIIAIVGYMALGVTPLLAMGPLLGRGSRNLARFGIVIDGGVGDRTGCSATRPT